MTFLDALKFYAIVAAVSLALAFAGLFLAWRWNARMDDCRSLGHGTFYCVVVWGGR